MEVSVLSEQVDAQSSKIQELEIMLQEKKDSLRQMDEALQKVRQRDDFVLATLDLDVNRTSRLLVFKEVLSRSALETQKLELLTSLSEMKLRQASLEHENLALRSASPLSNVGTCIYIYIIL